MTAPIPRALTPDEWARQQKDGADEDHHVRRNGTTGIYISQGYCEGASVDDPATLHAVAAFALYGQSFGFTREDVTLLNGYAEFFRREGWTHPRLAELDTLAAKLAALLPDA